MSSNALSPSPLLRRTLRANAAFSAGCGALLLLLAAPMAPLFGLPSGAVLQAVGIGLLPFAAVLAWSAGRAAVPRRWVLAFTAADVSWVIGSGILLLLAWNALSVTGRALIIAVALVVEAFATLQAREIVSGGARASGGSPA